MKTTPRNIVAVTDVLGHVFEVAVKDNKVDDAVQEAFKITKLAGYEPCYVQLRREME